MAGTFTRTAGGFAIAAAVMWLAVVALYWIGISITEDWNTAAYLLWTALIMIAGAFGVVSAVGIRQLPASAKTLAAVGVTILGIGTVLSFISWAIPVWMTVQGVGMLLVGLSAWSQSEVARLPLTAYGGGMLTGLVAFVVLNLLKVGTPDAYGDYPVAWGGSLTVGLVITALGHLGVGNALRSHDPSDVRSSMVGGVV